jgi:DNA-binding SARP family transcriptional activator
MRVRVLGPVGIWVDDNEVPVPAGKPRAILAMLALAGGRAVTAEQLIVGLWGEDPPPTAAKTLQVHVSTMRSRLRDSDATLLFASGGYRLSVDPDAIDSARFERLADDGLAALGEGRADVASRLLRSALAEWAGEPLSNVLDSPFAALEADRLALRRLAVVQARVEADLSLGLGATLVDELRAIADASPYDERACGQLMVALYRSGQPAAALAVYRSFRSTLGEELGLEVGPGLVELEQQVLMHDDSLLSAPARPASH